MQNNITEKAILCTTNESVNKFNSILLLLLFRFE